MTTNDQPMDHVPPDEAADETQDNGSSDLEKNVKQKSTWVRLFFMLLLAFLYGLSRVVMVAVVVFQFFFPRPLSTRLYRGMSSASNVYSASVKIC